MGIERIIVIGAGIAGLVAARTLTDAGRSVVVLDKSRGVGGRLATRRLARGACDHGAQFVTIKSAEFLAICDPALQSGALTPWTETSGHTRYRGAPSMSAFAKALAQGASVELEREVDAVVESADGWTACDRAGRTWWADAVILTAPLPQALAMLARGGVPAHAAADELSGVKYHPCFALMLALDGPSAVPSPGDFRPSSDDLVPDIAWIADNRQKGVSPAVTTLTVHATPAFSASNFDVEPMVTTLAMKAMIQPWLGSANVVERVLHRWRYSQPIIPLSTGFFRVKTSQPLYIAGDAFLGASVESAALSGRRAAQHLLAEPSCDES